jgi:hypothetical protein
MIINLIIENKEIIILISYNNQKLTIEISLLEKKYIFDNI